MALKKLILKEIKRLPHKLKKVPKHLLFWVGVLFFYTQFFGYKSQSFNYVLLFSAFLMPVTIATTYVVIYFLIPKYLLVKKYWLFLLYSIYTLILSAYFIVISIFYGLIFLSEMQVNNMAPISKSLFFILIGVYLIVFIASSFKLVIYNTESITKNQELKNRFLESQLQLKEHEVSYLKMQIHPHFLFNTLNTLYGFALRKADETPDLILRLSNLLDYLLYQTDKPSVNLESEIKHIRDYLELEKVRFKDTLKLNFDTEGSFNQLRIAPMLIIPFVENAFKHGKIIDDYLQIAINIKVEDKILFLHIRNTAEEKSINKENLGIGLMNIRKRLEILYKGNFELKTILKDGWYSVELLLNTSEKINKNE